MTHKKIIQHDPLAMLDDDDVLPDPMEIITVDIEQPDSVPSVQEHEIDITSNDKNKQKEMPVANSETIELALGEQLTIQVVADLYEQISVLFDTPVSVEINAEEVDVVDCAGLQLMAAFFKEAAQQQIDVSWKQSSMKLKTAADSIGMSELLCLKV